MQSVFFNKPRSLASFRLVSQLKGEGMVFRTVIDGGANIGQFARAAHRAFPEAEMFSFEPLPDVCDELRRNLADVERLRVFQTAIGNQDGETEFHRNAYSQASSVLPIEGSCHRAGKQPDETVSLRIPIARLDSILADQPLDRPVLLKLDLQGYELEALRGAERVLQQCTHVVLESGFDGSYQGEPAFEETWTYLRDHGFSFVRPLAVLSGQAGQIVQMDALFRSTKMAKGGRSCVSSSTIIQDMHPQCS